MGEQILRSRSGWSVAVLAALAVLVAPAESVAQDSTQVGMAESSGWLGGGPEDRSAGFGLHAFGDFFPSSGPAISEVTPFEVQTRRQQSIYTGLRMTFPIYRGLPGPLLPGIFGIADFGVAFAGPQAGTGEGGLAFGLGAEARWRLPQLNDLVMPFVRAKFDRRVVRFNESSSGTLFGNAFILTAGAHLVKVIDLHVMLGGTYASGFSTGIGLGIGHMF